MLRISEPYRRNKRKISHIFRYSLLSVVIAAIVIGTSYFLILPAVTWEEAPGDSIIVNNPSDQIVKQDNRVSVEWTDSNSSEEAVPFVCQLEPGSDASVLLKTIIEQKAAGQQLELEQMYSYEYTVNQQGSQQERMDEVLITFTEIIDAVDTENEWKLFVCDGNSDSLDELVQVREIDTENGQISLLDNHAVQSLRVMASPNQIFTLAEVSSLATIEEEKATSTSQMEIQWDSELLDGNTSVYVEEISEDERKDVLRSSLEQLILQSGKQAEEFRFYQLSARDGEGNSVSLAQPITVKIIFESPLDGNRQWGFYYADEQGVEFQPVTVLDSEQDQNGNFVSIQFSLDRFSIFAIADEGQAENEDEETDEVPVMNSSENFGDVLDRYIQDYDDQIRWWDSLDERTKVTSEYILDKVEFTEFTTEYQYYLSLFCLDSTQIGSEYQDVEGFYMYKVQMPQKSVFGKVIPAFCNNWRELEISALNLSYYKIVPVQDGYTIYLALKKDGFDSKVLRTELGFRTQVEIGGLGHESMQSSSTLMFNFKKINAETNEPVAGAKYGIVNIDDTEERIELITGKDGKAAVTDGALDSKGRQLSFMNYKFTTKSTLIYENALHYLVEREAPEGYMVDPKHHWFTIIQSIDYYQGDRVEEVQAYLEDRIDMYYDEHPEYQNVEYDITVLCTDIQQNPKLFRVQTMVGNDKPEYRLPETGRGGHVLFYVAGTALILIAVIGMRRKNERG